MKKRTAAFALALAAMLIHPTYANAEEEYLPTVYIADDVWYKDKSQPMITDGKDGFFISLDAFGALPEVYVTYDRTVNAVLLTFDGRSFSADSITGTVISPGGDTAVSIRHDESGTIYLSVEDVCRYLGLSCETHFYPSGKRAVRINDGSGTLDLSVLVRMFVNQSESLTRITGEPTTAYATEIFKAASTSELEAAAKRLQNGDRNFILALEAELVLSYADAVQLCSLLNEVYASGIPVTLFSLRTKTDEVLSCVQSANTRLLDLMHRGTHLFTPTTELSETDLNVIKQYGFMLTNFTFQEAE